MISSSHPVKNSFHNTDQEINPKTTAFESIPDNSELAEMQKLSSKTPSGRVWSVLSGIGSLILSPIYGVYNLISKLAHYIFSSSPNNDNSSTSSPNLDIDGHIPKIPPQMFASLLNGSQTVKPSENRDEVKEEKDELKNSKLNDKQPLIDDQFIDDQIDNLLNDLSDDLVSDKKTSNALSKPLQAPSRSEPSIIKIPALGDCLFMAFAVGLRKLYTHDEKINQLLDWDYDPNLLPQDLSTSKELTDLLTVPARILRHHATINIEKKLNCLIPQIAETPNETKFRTTALKALEQNNGYITQDMFEQENAASRKLISISETINRMKAAISEYNGYLDRKIQGSVNDFHLNVARSTEDIDNIMFDNEAGIAKEVFMSHADGIHRNLMEFKELCDKRIRCKLEGFESSEIPEILRYLEVMQKDGNYSGWAEAIPLSEEFNVPINIYDSQSNRLIDEINNSKDPNRPPICLSYNGNGEHFNLILQ
jgi:hypothetical protein